MKPPNKLIRDKLTTFLLKYLRAMENYDARLCEDLSNEFVVKVAEAAKAEERERILGIELKFGIADDTGSTKRYWMQLGVDRFKALLTPNKKEV